MDYALKLREDAMPVISRERGIPFALLPVVAQKLKDLVSKGVLVETSQADWASAIVVVRKTDGNIRICGDFRDLNRNLVVTNTQYQP